MNLQFMKRGSYHITIQRHEERHWWWYVVVLLTVSCISAVVQSDAVKPRKAIVLWQDMNVLHETTRNT